METATEDTDLPEGWILCHSKSIKGKVYYFNTLTGESLWEHPEAILYNDQGTEKRTPIRTAHSKTSEYRVNYTDPIPVAKDNLKIDNVEKSTKEAELANGRKFTSDKKLMIDNNHARGSISLSGRKVNETELKLKPISRILKKSKVPIIGKESKGAKIKKNITTKNAAKLNNALDLLNEKPGSVTNGYIDKKPPSRHLTNRLSNGNEDSLKKSRELGEDTGRKKMLNGKVGNKSFANDNATKAVNNIGSLRFKNEANGNSWVKSRNASENEKLKNRNPLKPLKHRRLDQVNYKVAGNSTNVVDSLAKGQPANTMVSRKFTPPKQIIRENTIKYPPGTIGSRDAQSDRGSSSDMIVPGAMETEEVDEPSEETWCTHSESLEEEMEIDDVEFMSKRILKQIENIRMERIEIPEMDYDHTGSTEVELEGTHLFIVLDTNILLSHLKFVRELMDSPIPGAGRPTIIIPWMVTQELDRLKSAPDSRVHEFEDDDKPVVSVNILARRAIALLSECFSENHPRLKGQTAYEARQPIEGLIQETNDDNILHCCLVVKAKAPQAKTVLLSRDRNLCNKAIVNGVKAFDNKKLINGLRDLFQSGNIIVHKDHYKEYFKVAENQEFLAERRKKADDLVCELQCILREAFTVIVEKEMKEAYDDLWSTVVKIKPPWTLSDTLDLLDKHWIAVFGHVVHRSLKPSIQELRAKFYSGDATLRDLENAGKLIDLGYHICDAFANHSDYSGVMPKCMAALIVLQRSYEQCSANLTQLRHADQEKQPLSLHAMPPLDNSDEKLIPECVNRVLHDSPQTAESGNAQTNPQRHPHFTVMSSFDEIWKAVRVLSSSVFHSLEYPNPYQDEGNVMPQRSSREETFRFLNQFIPCLEGLVQAIQKVVACPVESSMENTAVFVDLGESIAHFMKEMMCQDCSITLFELHDFCIDNQCRTALIQGLSQLDRALAMLQHCASFAANRS